MKLLLDSHALLWSFTSTNLLPEKTKDLISDTENKCLISMASLWEIGIKFSQGRLELDGGIAEILRTMDDVGYEILPITAAHILRVSQLPFHHRDPFDRLIIAQAITENLKVVTKDDLFNLYDVSTIWK